jgi:hypothetical protein
MAAQGALNTFLMNATILGVSNVFEYKYLSKLMGKAAPSVDKGLIGGAANLGEEATVAAASPLWKTIGKQTSLGILREGVYEENMQLAIQRYNTEYGIQGKIGGIFNVDTWGNVLKQASKQTVDAVYGNDSEAAQSIGMGGLIGSIFGSFTTRIQENKEQKNAQAIMTAFNNSQNSFLKFGDVFKYNTVDSIDKEFLKIAADLLKDVEWNESTWSIWTEKIKQQTNKKGKELFLPLRLSLTAYESGPEMKLLILLIGKDKVLQRLCQ